MSLINNLQSAGAGSAETPVYSIRIIYDNTSAVIGCQPDWGFSCLVNGSIMFDTGKSFDIFANNMQFLGVNPIDIRKIILSHNHNDHTGGLQGLLSKVAPRTEVFGAGGLIGSMQGKSSGAVLHSIQKTVEIAEGIYALAPIPCLYSGSRIEETVLVLVKANELCIITGCAHPGLKSIIDNVKAEFPGKAIGLLMGGFHFFKTELSELEEITASLKESGVRKVAPVHCTGKASIEYLRNAFGADFLEGGTGKEIRF